ncbi:hypothetical protein Vafri_6015, partial [Volvox africanus]
MADQSFQPPVAYDADIILPQGNMEHHIVFLLDVDALAGCIKNSGSVSLAEDYSGQMERNHVPNGREGDGKFLPDRLAEALTRLSQVYTQLHGLPTAVSYHMISTKSKFTQEKIEMLKTKIANNPALAEVGAGTQNAGGAGGSSKGPETRTPFTVHAEMYALLKAIGEPVPEGSAYGPSSSSWLENIGHHVQQTVSRFLVAMNAAAAHRCAKVKAATFVLVTPAPLQGRPVRPLDPLAPELLAALRQVNARFMWLDPAGGADVTHKAQMEMAVAAAATSVGEAQPIAVTESDLAEVQLALALSSHWRLEGAHADCMTSQPGLILPLLPVAWLPVADVFRSKAVLETIVRRIVAQGPPDPFGPLRAGFNLVAFPGYVTQFTSQKWIYQVWSETTTLTTTSYLRGIIANRYLKLPPLRVRA